MNKYDTAILKIAEHGQWITTKKLDEILFEVWGNKYDAGMCCNSFMRQGLIDYAGDGDWEILVEPYELDFLENSP